MPVRLNLDYYTIGEEDDLPSLLKFLHIISEREVPEFIVLSTICEQDSPLAISKSKAHQWLSSLVCELSLMHLSKINANASDSIAPILYNRIKQDPAIALSLEAFIYTRSQSIVKHPSIFIDLLALIYNYQIKEEITTSVFKQLAEEVLSKWIAKADQLIINKLFHPGEPYSVEALIEQIVESGPAKLYNTPSPDHFITSSHYLKKTTIEKVLKQQVVENLKPSITNQLEEVKNGYVNQLKILENKENALRESIKKVEKERSGLYRCFRSTKEAYKSSASGLKAEEKALKIEIDKLVKENEEKLKKSEEAVKQSEEKLGDKAGDDASKPGSVQTGAVKEQSKIASLQEKLNELSKTRSNLTTSYKVKKESYEASSAALSNQINNLEADLLKLAAHQKPIKLKIEALSKEDAVNFSDYSLYKEVLDSFCKLKPTLRNAEDKPLDPYSRSALSQWSKEIKRKGLSLFSTHTISEIITGINQAATLSNHTRLTKSQHLDLLRALFPFCKQAQLQRSKDPLVIVFLAAICVLQNGQVSLVTDSKEWAISESDISSYLPLFEVLGLTARKRDKTDPLSRCKSDIVYGKGSDFAAIPHLMAYKLLQQKKQCVDKSSSQLSNRHSSRSVIPSTPVTRELAPIDACTLSTLLRLAASAPVTCHALEAHYRGSMKIQKEKEALKTLKDAADKNVDVSYEFLIDNEHELIDSIEASTDPVGRTVEALPTPSVAYKQLKQQYDSIEASYQSPSRMLQSSTLSFRKKPIAQWNEEEITKWATYVQAHYQPGLEIELIAGVQHAVNLHYPFSPRPTQLLALLALLHPTYDKGRLAQINTGEGKSLIVAMLAAIHGLQGKQVDVITTSTELSVPEVKEKRAFFKLFNLSVSENSPSSDKIGVYNHQIVYGTASDFQADILREEFLGENIRGDRGYDIVLVDEVDSLLFDNPSHSVRLGSSHPGMEHLELPLGTIWQYTQWMQDHMFEYEGQVYFTAKDSVSPDSDISSDESIIPIQEDKRTFITRMTRVYLEKLLRNLDATESQAYEEHFKKRSEIAQVEQKIKSIKEAGGTAQEDIQLRDKLSQELQNLPWSQRAPILAIPNHLRQFARIQLPSWIKHCLSARFDYKIKKDYIVSEDKRIVPVQYNETGVLQHNLVWSDGLCQFLQIKEGLSVDPESISTNAFSNIGFFKRYGKAIYGLTGTLGESATRDFLEALYGVDFVVIPPYQRTKIQDNSHTPYLCKALRPILAEEKDWCPAILYHLLHHAKQGRAALAICKSIKHAEYLEAQLKAHYDPNKVFTYTGVTTLKDDKVTSGDIILGTNIVGRGTDLKTSQEVEDKGGMYVAVTFLPETKRVELQNVGRTARAGKKGMAQLIVSNPDGSSLEALEAARQAKEIKTTQHALEEAKKTLGQDALREHFCRVANNYLPSAADCKSMDQAATILPAWNQILQTKFTDGIIDEQFEKSIAQAKQKWYTLFSGDEIPHSHQLDADLSSKKEAFRSAYRNKLLEDFQSAHPILSSSLLSCLQKGEPFKPNRPALAEKYDWGSFERKAVGERWGIWLKGQDIGESDYASEDTLAVFKNFDHEFAVQLAQDAGANQLIKNPYFYTLKGNQLLSNGRDKDAIISYNRAIALDEIFSLHSRYNKARALLFCKENKGYNQREAYKALKTAKNLIYTLYRPNLMAFHGLVGHGAKTHTVSAIQHDLDIVSQQEKYIQQALEVLRDSGATSDKKPVNVSLTHQSLASTFKDPNAAMAHGKAIREAGLKGLSDLFTIKKAPPYPFFSIISMALISLGQIALGCLLTAYGGAQLGLSLIKNGISDMVTTIKSAFKGSFDWGAWAIQKGIEIMIAVASYGISVAKEAIQGAKTTAESVKTGILGAKQAAKDILSGKGLKDITVETVTGEIKKSPQQIVKETLTTQLKQRATGELIENTANCLADELWVKQQAEKIRKVVNQSLTQAFTTNELITSALQLDREEQNTDWQECFLGEAHSILHDMLKSDSTNQVLKQIGKGTIYNTVYKDFELGGKDFIVDIKGVEVAAGVLGATLKSCSNKIDSIAPLTKKFIEAFSKRIATYKDQIAQANRANRTTQAPILTSTHQTMTMAAPLPIDNQEEIVIAKIDDISHFRPADRSANPIRETFSNLGPSTPENLVSELEAYLSGEAIQNINDQIMAGASYGANWVNEQLFKKANQENQKFLDGLEKRGANRYIGIKKEQQQQKLEEEELRQQKIKEKELKDKKEEDKAPKEKETSSVKQSNGQAKSKKESIVDPDTAKAIKELREGDPLTRAHISMLAHLVTSPIHIVDERGQLLGEAIGGYKSGNPILLGALPDKNGKITHITPLNLTPAQKKQYESLNHTKNDCVLNSLFVHLSEKKQKELRDIEGMRKAA